MGPPSDAAKSCGPAKTRREEPMDESMLQAIRGKAEMAEALASAQERAVEDERAAEAELLAAVVAAVRPAIRALSYRIHEGYRSWWVDNVMTDEEYTPSKHRGVTVAGCGPERDYPSADRGHFEGERLILVADYARPFVLVTYRGKWSRWQGESDKWEASFLPLTCREVIDRGEDVGTIVESLSTALDKQLDGGRKKATAAAAERAARFRALTLLLKK